MASVEVKCQQCGGKMHKGHKVDRSIALQLVGVMVFLLGIGLLVLFPIGTFFGLILMVVSARMGYSRRKSWNCEACGYFFERT